MLPKTKLSGRSSVTAPRLASSTVSFELVYKAIRILTDRRGGTVSSKRSDLRPSAHPFSAAKFDVPHDFVLQQTAWLWERHSFNLAAGLKRNAPPNAATPPLGVLSQNASLGGVPMKRLGSGGSRAPSALSVTSRESPIQKGDGSMSGTTRTAGTSCELLNMACTETTLT